MLPRCHARFGALALVVLALAASRSATAQSRSAAVVPPYLTAAEGNAGLLWAGVAIEARRQLLIDARFLAARAGEDIVALRVRQNADDDLRARAGRVWLEIALSNTAASPDRPSAELARQRGADHAVVFTGYVSFPAAEQPKTRPATWEGPHAISIPLQKPFRYTGGALCVEAVTRPVAPNDTATPMPPWFSLDAEVRDPTGSMARYGTSCIPGMAGNAAGAAPATLAVGSTAIVNLKGTRSSGLALLGVGAARLSISLDQAGAPGCTLYTDPLFLVATSIAAMPKSPIGVAVAELPLPAVTELAGARLFAQWFVLDPTANRFGFTFSEGLDVMLGRPNDLGVAWIEAYDLKAASGQVVTDRTPVLELTFEKR